MTACKDPIKELEHRRKIGDAAILRYQNPEARKKTSLSLIGKKRTEEQRKKMSESQKGKKLPKETIKKMLESRKGYRHSEETRKKMSESSKRKYLDPNERLKTGLSQIGKHKKTRQKMSEETKQKLREKHLGKKLTPEHCKKLSIAHIGVQAKEKHPNWTGGHSEYCEKWNLVFKKRIRLWNAHNHKGIVICECCGAIQTKKLFNCHHVYYDKKACCSVNENGVYYSNLGIKGAPHDFEIVGDPNKFIVLCDGCHAKTNSKKRRAKWARYYEKIINEKYNGKSFFTQEEFIAYPC